MAIWCIWRRCEGMTDLLVWHHQREFNPRSHIHALSLKWQADTCVYCITTWSRPILSMVLSVLDMTSRYILVIFKSYEDSQEPAYQLSWPTLQASNCISIVFTPDDNVHQKHHMVHFHYSLKTLLISRHSWRCVLGRRTNKDFWYSGIP